MIGIKFGDPHKIVMGLLKLYIQRQLASGNVTKTAESMGHYLTGMKISRYYRVDLSEPNRSIVAREFLRGVIADHKAV